MRASDASAISTPTASSFPPTGSAPTAPATISSSRRLTDPAAEDSTIVQAILNRAQILGDSESLFRLVARWPLLLVSVVRALDAAGQLDWIGLVRERFHPQESKVAK